MKRFLSAGAGYGLCETPKPILFLVPKLSVPIKILVAVGICFIIHVSVAKQPNSIISNGSQTWMDSQVEEYSSADSLFKYGLVIGDTIPEWFWHTELNVVNHPGGDGRITLADFRSHLLVLNFWSTGCIPCVRSMHTWNDILQDYNDEITVIGVHVYDGHHKVDNFLERTDLKIPIVLNNSIDPIINRLFYSHRSWGQVWIKNGVFVAVPKWKAVNYESVAHYVKSGELTLEMNYSLTYMMEDNQ